MIKKILARILSHPTWAGIAVIVTLSTFFIDYFSPQSNSSSLSTREHSGKYFLAEGIGIYPEKYSSQAQRKYMAQRAAEIDGMRKLAEKALAKVSAISKSENGILETDNIEVIINEHLSSVETIDVEDVNEEYIKVKIRGYVK